MKVHLTTPSAISPAILEFCDEITPGGEPEYVSVHPREGAKDRECFYNVRDAVESEGGGIVYGWCIWEWPGMFLEAEFHAIWERSDKLHLDVTPKSDGEASILFLPDSRYEFDFGGGGLSPRGNVHKPLSRNPDVKEYLDISKRLEEMRGVAEAALEREALQYRRGELLLVLDKLDRRKRWKWQR